MSVAGFALLLGLLGPTPVATDMTAEARRAHVFTPSALTTRGLFTRPSSAKVPPATRLDGLTVPVTLNGPVREWIAFFQGRGRPIYARWLARKGRYEAMMAPILEREGVPAELLYLCMIESGFTPDAVSRAAAVGPWQFIMTTGRQYELRYDAWVDERRDPRRSTAAAARHLHDLYARFGSWPLAMAAYNAGGGGVRKAMRRANSNDFWRLSAAGTLPNEATRYVPKIMAAMVIGQDPARYGFGDVQIDAALDGVKVEVRPGLDLRVLARSAGIELSALTTYNPSLRRGFVPPDGNSWPLWVPRAHAKAVAAAAARLEDRRPGLLVEHTVRFGEHVRDIAWQYGVSRRTVRRLNELPHGQPMAGVVLVVPKPSAKSASGASDDLLVLTVPELSFAYADRDEVFFPVRHAVPVHEVAAFFKVTPGVLATWNGLDPDASVQRGQVLRIFVPRDFDRGTVVLVSPDAVTRVVAGTDAARNALARAKRPRAAGVKRVYHTVKRGQNLWKIAQRHDVTVAALRAENGLGRRTGLKVGQRLRVPKLKASKPRGKARRAKPKANARGGGRYKVRRGDSLWRIARKFDIEVDDLRKRNGLKRRHKLTPGEVLVVPRRGRKAKKKKKKKRRRK